MAEKTIRTALCPGGRLRLGRLLRLIEGDRIDPTPLTTHRFGFEEIADAFAMMDAKSDCVIKPLVVF
jgi:threonine dehydrogenase-like Zn-dependent dehydrogenase